MPDKMVLIRWVDSSGHGRWVTREEAERDRLSVCESIGWLIVDDDVKMVIYQSLDHVNDTVNGCMSIPKVAIQDVKYLRVK